MTFTFSPRVHVLLVNESTQKVRMQYDQHTWPMPLIKTRPPYYTDPKYGFNFSTI